jgi:hypothetical protein
MMSHHPTRTAMRMHPADSVHARMFDRELVILDVVKGEYFSLDEVGTQLWVGLENGKTVEDVAGEIVEQYAASIDRVLADLRALAADLIARGLMLPCSTDPSEVDP